MLDADAGDVRLPAGAPAMEALLSQPRIVPATAAFAVGIAVSALIQTPFGLLAPMAALFLFASSRAASALQLALAIGLVGSLLHVALYGNEARDVAATWAGFFALALCIGALLASRKS